MEVKNLKELKYRAEVTQWNEYGTCEASWAFLVEKEGNEVFTVQLANDLIAFGNEEYEKKFGKEVDFNVIRLEMTNSYVDEDNILDDGVSHPCYTVGKRKVGRYDKRKNLLRIFEDGIPVYENNDGKICRDSAALADSLM